jgi:hypothetical protein
MHAAADANAACGCALHVCGLHVCGLHRGPSCVGPSCMLGAHQHAASAQAASDMCLPPTPHRPQYDPETFTTWCNILKRVPNSVLWLLRFPPYGEANIRAEAARQGVDWSRIIFTDVAHKDLHIKWVMPPARPAACLPAVLSPCSPCFPHLPVCCALLAWALDVCLRRWRACPVQCSALAMRQPHTAHCTLQACPVPQTPALPAHCAWPRL